MVARSDHSDSDFYELGEGKAFGIVLDHHKTIINELLLQSNPTSQIHPSMHFPVLHTRLLQETGRMSAQFVHAVHLLKKVL